MRPVGGRAALAALLLCVAPLSAAAVPMGKAAITAPASDASLLLVQHNTISSSNTHSTGLSARNPHRRPSSYRATRPCGFGRDSRTQCKPYAGSPFRPRSSLGSPRPPTRGLVRTNPGRLSTGLPSRSRGTYSRGISRGGYSGGPSRGTYSRGVSRGSSRGVSRGASRGSSRSVSRGSASRGASRGGGAAAADP